MNAALKIIPRDKRLRVTAIYSHRTVQYGGNVFEFIDQLIKEGCTGHGTFSMNQGDAYNLQFDFREKVVDETVK